MKHMFKRKITSVAIIAISAIAVLLVSSCSSNGAAGTISWTATTSQSSTGTTAINVVFSSVPAGLSAQDFSITTLGGNATAGVLTGSGTNWRLAIFVTTPGQVRLSINRSGIQNSYQVLTLTRTSPILRPAPPPPIAPPVFSYAVVGSGQVEITGLVSGSVHNLTIPAILSGYDVMSIEFNAFNGIGLTGTLTIPESLLVIGYSAFQANNIQAIIILGATSLIINMDVFSDNPNLQIVTVGPNASFHTNAFDLGDFETAYTANGAGTYTWNGTSWDWTAP